MHVQMRPYEQLNALDFVLNLLFFKVVDLFLKSTRPCSLSTHLASSKSNTYTLKCFYKIPGIASA